MIIIDTTVWIDYLAGTINAHSAWLDQEMTRQRLGLTDLILCEVLQGIRDDVLFKATLHNLSRFDLFSCAGADLAIAAAENYRALRRRGYTVRKTIDCFIATFCMQSGHALLHRDHDFDPFEAHLGLVVIHP